MYDSIVWLKFTNTVEECAVSNFRVKEQASMLILLEDSTLL
jgi:hypothetical protein